ncbi:TrkH family potassium uptake protein [Candidatus Tokpelaia sp.]|uniref:TrkH family potassium uptake protein n=1 Tax=Candidatus Tokpelaia sp. TaxID=2233777 RepID=UPI001238E2EF|nr:TrkH family potassium uptake protein [Candidatus Tokpelaia sp.]KAA6405081.1 TrkH family potassium uptake protein [Candidatus Tokpelaia sp.]
MAVAMLLPVLSDLRTGSGDWLVFVHSALTVFILASLVLVATRGASAPYTARVGFLLTVSLWITACLLGSLPLYFSRLPISFAQAAFESVSGVTTSGATMLTGLDKLPRGILLWRSLLAWIGGVGFIAVALLLLPSLRVGGVKLFYAESSTIPEKVLPRIHQIGNAILLSYLALTLVCILCYFAAGMSLFDALNHAMTTVSTAGFSTHDNSLGFYARRPLILLTAIVFMLLSSLPFIFYIKAALPRQRRRLLDPQVKVFLILIAAVGLTLTFWLHFARGLPLPKALLNAFFHFVSVLTTTGYTTEDYSLWGPFAFGIFFLACFIGGCSGSTSGGVKVSRLIILWHLTIGKLTALISPHRIIKVHYGETEIGVEPAQNILLFVCLYITSIIGGSALLLAMGLDFVSAFSGAVSALSNIGQGSGSLIGPGGNYAGLHDNALWILSFLMLSGRLEIITVFVLFLPAFWQR